MQTHRVFNGVPHCRGKKWRPIMRPVMATVADYSILITIIKGWLVASSVHLEGASEWCFPSTFCRLLTARPVFLQRAHRSRALSLCAPIVHTGDFARHHFQPNSAPHFYHGPPDHAYPRSSFRLESTGIERCYNFFARNIINSTFRSKDLIYLFITHRWNQRYTFNPDRPLWIKNSGCKIYASIEY